MKQSKKAAIRKKSNAVIEGEENWDRLAREAQQNAWEKSDEVWDKVAREDLKWNKKK